MALLVRPPTQAHEPSSDGATRAALKPQAKTEAEDNCAVSSQDTCSPTASWVAPRVPSVSATLVRVSRHGEVSNHSPQGQDMKPGCLMMGDGFVLDESA